MVGEMVTVRESIASAGREHPRQVGEALAVLENVFGYLKEAERLQHRVKRIGENIEQFEARLPDSSQPSTPPSLPSLRKLRLRSCTRDMLQAGKAETERDTLEAQNAADETGDSELQAQSPSCCGHFMTT